MISKYAFNINHVIKNHDKLAQITARIRKDNKCAELSELLLAFLVKNVCL